MDAHARELEVITSSQQLSKLIISGRFENQHYVIFGWWSNILLTKDIEGIVLLNNILWKDVIKKDNDTVTIRVWWWEQRHNIVIWTVQQGWRGIENLVLIPGSVWASPIQNIWAYWVEVKDSIVSVTVIDINSWITTELSAAECWFDYRYSIFKKSSSRSLFITHVTYCLSIKPHRHIDYKDIQTYIASHHLDSETLSSSDIAEMVSKIRCAKLPDWQMIGTAGSFFKNPIVSTSIARKLHHQYPEMPIFNIWDWRSKLSAGRLIEQCGYKNIQRWPVGTYKYNALVLVHYGWGTWSQVRQLAEEIMQIVKDHFGILIEPEVNII